MLVLWGGVKWCGKKMGLGRAFLLCSVLDSFPLLKIYILILVFSWNLYL